MICVFENEHTFKFYFMWDDVVMFEQEFGDDFSMYNQPLREMLEEIANAPGFPGISRNQCARLVNIVSDPNEGLYALFVIIRKIRLKAFGICFLDLDSCILFSKSYKMNAPTKLLKNNKLYYLIVGRLFKEEDAYLAGEFSGTILNEPVKLKKLKREGEVIIAKEAMEKLAKI